MFWKLQENVITDSDLARLITFLKETKRFTQFEKVAEFERAFATWQGCNHCIYVNSGSSANLLVVNAAKEQYGWVNGDEAIVPSVTWPTTVTPVLQSGLSPVFVDTNLTDLSLDYDRIEALITPRTKAIFVAHLLGFPADISRLQEIIADCDIVLLEDCCESQGATHHGVHVGNMGLASTFSFYWGHHMTSVEGGMICTNDEEMYKLMLLKRSHGLARELPSKYHAECGDKYKDIDFNFLFLTDGFNVRNTEFNAVLGLAQLERIDTFIALRNSNYRQFLHICAQYKDELVLLDVSGCSSFTLPFIFRRQKRKEDFQEMLRSHGIETRPLISGNLLRQPFLKKYYNPKDYLNADFIHTNAFYIGNNQFVDAKRLHILDEVMNEFFTGSK